MICKRELPSILINFANIVVGIIWRLAPIIPVFDAGFFGGNGQIWGLISRPKQNFITVKALKVEVTVRIFAVK